LPATWRRSEIGSATWWSLNAPGQQEVWRYYDPGLPVLALPQQRPSDPAAVEAALQPATAGRRQVYALFWATVEADPEQQVERWLDLHAFKTLDSWQGALRFVVYALADDLQAGARGSLYGGKTALCSPVSSRQGIFRSRSSRQRCLGTALVDDRAAAG
jgi:hypothetical protein